MGDMDNHPKRAAENFFGRRKGQKLRGRKERAMTDRLPALRLDLKSPAPDSLADLFDAPVASIMMEIGFGGGEHLAGQADQNREIGFIGVEPFINGMAKMLGQIEDRQLNNVRLYDDDATQVLDWLPDASLSRIDLLYPDPWPKKRHWKRRFVSQSTLSKMHRVLRPDGLFRFASDIDTYVDWTLAHVWKFSESTGSGLQWQAERADDWRQPWDGWTRTRYEAKAIREGRTPAYLQFRKV